MTTTPSPADDDWNSWATLSNDVSAALRQLPTRPLFSQRRAVAQELWHLGYRPTDEQVREMARAQR